MSNKRANSSSLQIDYNPHRIHSTGSGAGASADLIEFPATPVGESYDLGEVMTFEAVSASTEETCEADALVPATSILLFALTPPTLRNLSK